MMTEAQAIENIRCMKAETPKNAMKRILEIALTQTASRLSDDAKEIYRTELAKM